MPALTYSFSDLPTIVDDGYEAGFVEGQAHVSFDLSGVWLIDDISIEVSRWCVSTTDLAAHGARKSKNFTICKKSNFPMWAHMMDWLETNCGDDIQHKVEEELAREGISIREVA
jgi:hypothetical protein